MRRFITVLTLLATQVICGEISNIIWLGSEHEYFDREFIFRLKDTKSEGAFREYLDNNDIEIISEINNYGGGLIFVPEDQDVYDVRLSIHNLEYIRWCEPNLVYRTFATFPNDEYFTGNLPVGEDYNHQWGLHNTGQDPPDGHVDADMDIPEAWDYGTGDPNLLIGVLDSGFPVNGAGNLLHPDLDDISRFVVGPNFYSTDINDLAQDLLGHGTHVAGIIAAEANNGIGVAGINWHSRLMAIGVTNDGSGMISPTAIVSAIDYAILSDVDIINCSWGGGYVSDIHEAILRANDEDILIVCAAGNCLPGDADCLELGVFFPARLGFAADEIIIEDYMREFDWELDHIISVGASTEEDQHASYSSYNQDQENHIHVAAPGGRRSGVYEPGMPFQTDDIFSTTPPYSYNMQTDHPELSTHYSYLGGTSMAAPMVTGVLSLIKSRFPSLSNLEIKNILLESAEDISLPGYDFLTGHGRVNAFYAVAPPNSPQNLQLSGAIGSPPVLTWDMNSEPDIQGYRIYKREGNGQPFLLNTVPSSSTSYTDYTCEIGTRFDPRVYYHICAIDVSALESEPSNFVRTNVGSIHKDTSGDTDELEMPLKGILFPAFPNPFNPSTMIRYGLAESANTSLVIYDAHGNIVNTLISGHQSAGWYNVVWNGETVDGKTISAGIYFARLVAGEYSQVIKMLYLR